MAAKTIKKLKPTSGALVSHSKLTNPVQSLHDVVFEGKKPSLGFAAIKDFLFTKPILFPNLSLRTPIHLPAVSFAVFTARRTTADKTPVTTRHGKASAATSAHKATMSSRINILSQNSAIRIIAVVVLIFGILALAEIFLTRSITFNNKTPTLQSTKPAIDQSESLTPDTTNTSVEVYQVKTGDSLWSIAQEAYGTGYAWKNIAKANNLGQGNIIHAGNRLILPKLAANTGPGGAAMAPTGPENRQTFQYTVKHGDSLWSIAKEVYGDPYAWPQVAQTNNLTNPSLIFAGNVLTIPAKPTAPPLGK